MCYWQNVRGNGGKIIFYISLSIILPHPLLSKIKKIWLNNRRNKKNIFLKGFTSLNEIFI
ncbi:unnamed protein product [Meloidogyne enterolobii]|uniref:Uncharacterized protein n=1 Tax=Meloidogyne enterolobii TaxID=390850 RepID=A0ACB0ZVD2_MELEN